MKKSQFKQLIKEVIQELDSNHFPIQSADWFFQKWKHVIWIGSPTKKENQTVDEFRTDLIKLLKEV